MQMSNWHLQYIVVELQKLGLVDEEELEGSNKMLFSAALTYVASLMSNMLQLLRLVLILGARNDDWWDFSSK